MRVALVHKRLDLNGGTERDLFQTAEGLRDLGHEVHLFCSEFGVRPPSGVSAHRVPVLPFGRTLRLWTFAWLAPRIIKNVGCDVVVSFGRLLRQDVLRSGGGTHRGFLERLGQEGGLRRRVWQSISVYHRSLLLLESRQFQVNGSAKIIAVSEEVKSDIVRHYSVPTDKVVVVYNGVDQNRFHPSKRAEVRESIRERWKIPMDSPLVLFVGSGFRRKGLDRILSIWKSPRLRDVFLLVVGDDARINRYLSLANSIAPGRIVFTGRRDDIENYYAAADVVALPALQEGFGNVVMEALASGLPVLVSRDVGAAEIIHGPLVQGIVDRVEDLRELEEKLLSLLAASRDPNWIREARQIGERHSWENHFKKIEAVLLEACRVPSGIAS
jgi:UDP-glucose:(heptosyl)LPS alpha-1,3-glucosyltransferase